VFAIIHVMNYTGTRVLILNGIKSLEIEIHIHTTHVPDIIHVPIYSALPLHQGDRGVDPPLLQNYATGIL
jgi:hypothetical protein